MPKREDVQTTLEMYSPPVDRKRPNVYKEPALQELPGDVQPEESNGMQFMFFMPSAIKLSSKEKSMRVSKLCMYAHDYLVDSEETKLFSRIDQKQEMKEQNVLLPSTQMGGAFLDLLNEEGISLEMTEDKEEEFRVQERNKT